MSARMLLVLVVLLVAGTARIAAASPPPEAAQLYRDGQAAFDVGHYDEAIAAWQRSYELSRAPALLYNLAQAHRLRAHDGDCGEARARYQDFVRLAEPSPQRSLAEGYITQLAVCASTPPPPETPIAAVAARVPARAREREVAVGVAAGGAALVITGLYLGHRATQLGDDVSSACTMSCDWSVEKGKDADGRRDATAGRVLDVLGALAIAGGGALFYLAHGDAEVAIAPISSSPHEAGAAVLWSHRW